MIIGQGTYLVLHRELNGLVEPNLDYLSIKITAHAQETSRRFYSQEKWEGVCTIDKLIPKSAGLREARN
jgi:hypothetical protein